MVTVSSRQWLLYLSLCCILTLSLMLFGCSKKEEAAPTSPSDQEDISSYVPESDPSTALSDYLTTDAEYRGLMNISASKSFKITAHPTTVVPVQTSTATASFSGSNHYSIDVGQVKLDDMELKKIEQRGRSGLKSYSYTTDPQTQTVDPAADHTWYIDGTLGKFDFPATKVAADLEITAPSNNSTISTSSDLEITWTGTSPESGIFIHITRLIRPLIAFLPPIRVNFIFLRVEDDGSFTVPVAKLKAFRKGEKLLITVMRAKRERQDVTDFGKVLMTASIQDNVLVTVK